MEYLTALKIEIVKGIVLVQMKDRGFESLMEYKKETLMAYVMVNLMVDYSER